MTVKKCSPLYLGLIGFIYMYMGEHFPYPYKGIWVSSCKHQLNNRDRLTYLLKINDFQLNWI